MRPVTVSIEVPQPPERVFEFIDVLDNHESFTDHLLLDWDVSGPLTGVGARARMRVRKPGRPDWLEMTVIESESPRRTVEESISARGARLTRGTYTLQSVPGGGTRVSFELAWERAPLGERLVAPLTRAIAKRANATSLQRLAAELAARESKSQQEEPT